MTPRDPGLQPERTLLSWRRTGWSMMIPGLLCLRIWFHNSEPLHGISALLLILTGAAMLVGVARGRISLIAGLVTGSALLLLIALSGVAGNLAGQ